MFANKVGTIIDPKLASRLNMQFIYEDKKICPALSHLRYSIGFSYESMHPTLLEL